MALLAVKYMDFYPVGNLSRTALRARSAGARLGRERSGIRFRSWGAEFLVPLTFFLSAYCLLSYWALGILECSARIPF